MDSEVQLEFHRQMKVMRRGNEINPNKYRKTSPGPPITATGIYAGFDTSIYPGDAAMLAWINP